MRTCITAVTNAMGLNSPDSQSDLGVAIASVHVTSCSQRSSRFANQSPSGLSDACATYIVMAYMVRAQRPERRVCDLFSYGLYRYGPAA